MQISELFDRAITRPINGVVKADQQDDGSVWQELDEFVVTRELDKHFRDFFGNYLRVIENINKPEVANQVGVWISGFFGSGKSHFLKVLSYLMGNRTLSFGGETKRTGDFFETKIKDTMFLADIRRAIAFPTDVILFNVETKADHSQSRDAILSILMRMLNELQGYTGHPAYIAHMERHLQKRGKLAAFHAAFQEATGKDWVGERDAPGFYRDEIIRSLSQALGTSIESATKQFDNAETEFSLTVENFCKWVRDYLDSKGPEHRIIFFADEVGAFIGTNSQLMLNLQTITETLGTTCEGRAWIVVTSQEDIDAVIGEMNSIRANDFSRITARFKTRLSLSSANVDEVIRARLLAKREVVQPVLRKIYADKGDLIKNQLIFGKTGMTMDSFKDAEDFAATYPFIPFQFKLLQKIFESIRKAGATGNHLARGERSLLDAFQSAAMQIAEIETGVLVPLYRFYPSIENFLDTSVKLTIERAGANPSLEPFDARLLEVLFLIRYVDEIKGSVDNLIVLCMDEIDADRMAMRRKIEESLLRLEKETLVSRNGDFFAFLTNEERDLSREIKRIDLDAGAEAKLMGDILFDEVLKEQRKHRFSANGKDIPFNRVCDRHPHGNRSENAVNLSVLTPLIDDYKIFGDPKCTLESTVEGGQLIVRLNDHPDLDRELRTYLKTEKYIARKNDGTQNSQTQRILRDFAEENRQRRGRLVAIVGDLLTTANYFAAGQPFTPKAAAPMAAMAEALDYLIQNTFTKMGYLKHLVAEPAREIQAMLRSNDIGQQALAIQTEQGNPEAINELRDFIRLSTLASHPIVLHDLVEERFSDRPYGWPSMETILLVTRLLVLGEIHLVSGGANVPLDRAYDELTTTARWRKLTLLQRKITDPAALQSARKLGQELFGAMGPDNEDSLAEFVRAKITGWRETLNLYKPLADTGDYPGCTAITEGVSLTSKLLAESENYKLLDRFNAQKSDLLEFSDSFHQVQHFYTTQKLVWDDLRKALQRFSLNRLELERDPAAAVALQRMQTILKAASPYKILSETRGLIDTVEVLNTNLIVERRATVMAEVERQCAATKGELDRAGNQEKLRNEVLGKFDQLRNTLASNESLAHIDQCGTEAARLFESTLSAIEEASRKPTSPSETTGGIPAPAPKVKPRRIIQVSSLLPKAFLETTEEVEEFLGKIRAELEEAIANNERAQIK